MAQETVDVTRSLNRLVLEFSKAADGSLQVVASGVNVAQRLTFTGGEREETFTGIAGPTVTLTDAERAVFLAVWGRLETYALNQIAGQLAATRPTP